MKSFCKTLLTLCLLLATTSVFAQETEAGGILSDDAQISIITCSPGTEIYALFGHSGMRVYDPQKHIDVTFNYGLFDFNQEDFVYRFVRGKTDYQVGVFQTGNFLFDYIARGSQVTEIVLNLSQSEKINIWLFLMNNIREENKTYRYNFAFNNCSTKLRDIVEQNVDGNIFFPDVTGTLSYRETIELYTKTSPWSQFGFDLCLGRGLDREAPTYNKMFIPDILESTMEQAIVNKNDSIYKLVLSKNVLNEGGVDNPSPLISPLLLGIILLLAVIALSIYCIKKRIELYWFDAVIFTLNALFGCLIAFLILFSKHPFTGANFNIIWLNPLLIVPLFFAIFKGLRRFANIYYILVSIVLTLFLIGSFVLEQDFNIAVYPFAMIYLVRSVTYVFRWGYKIS